MTPTHSAGIHTQHLPLAAPRPVLALGAHLKNTACWLEGDTVRWSALHGDLSEVAHCEALEASARALIAASARPPAAIAHDLHPDFFSTRLAQRLAHELQVPTVAVQHHRAHIAAVAAEHGLAQGMVGIALDGVGLGTDGTAWGGEVLWLGGCNDALLWQRCAHLRALPMPGGDRAAREPWRMAAAALHELGRGDEIVPRYAGLVGEAAARGVQMLLRLGVRCPMSTAAGRWFDAAAVALAAHTGQTQTEAQAAQAIQATAQAWLDRDDACLQPDVQLDVQTATLDLLPALATAFDSKPGQRPQAAAAFHAQLAAAVSRAATEAAHRWGVHVVALGGGCFANRILRDGIRQHLQAAGLKVAEPQQLSSGDAALALGQAWVASWESISIPISSAQT